MPDLFSKKDTIRVAEFVENDTSIFPRRDIAEIIEARFKDIFELAAKELKRIDKFGLLPAGVILVGGGSKIPGIPELAKRELKLPVEVGSNINFPKPADKNLKEMLFTYPVALGLVAWQINKSSGDDPYFYNPTFSSFASTLKSWLKMLLP